MNLEEKIKSMSADEIIMAMVNGLRRKWVEVDMKTFGKVRGGKRFGCAATNAVCEIMGQAIPKQYIETHEDFFKDVESFVAAFELSIDDLRSGCLEAYNQRAQMFGFAEISEPDFELPVLSTDHYLDNLEPYERLAEFQKEN